jgi:Cupredoxin-like domain
MKILLLAALALAGAAAAGVVANAGPTKSTIRVTEREYKISLSTRHTAVGRVRLEIKNAGKYAHALAIKGAGVNTRTKLIQPGKTAVLLVTLKRGSYSLRCPVPGHAAQGMKATLSTPTATPTGGGATTTTNTGTTGETTTTDIGYGY